MGTAGGTWQSSSRTTWRQRGEGCSVGSPGHGRGLDAGKCQTSRAGWNASAPMQRWYAASTPTRRGSCGPTRLS